MSLNLSAAPFNLEADRLAWVDATFARLTPAQRLAQLFVLRRDLRDVEGAKRIHAFQPGGITVALGANAAAELADIADLTAASPIRPTISADLEGSRMSPPFGTETPNPLALAAINDLAASQDIARIMAEEARAIGINWTFTPVLDINTAFRSAIVATRGFGSDVARLKRRCALRLPYSSSTASRPLPSTGRARATTTATSIW